MDDVMQVIGLVQHSVQSVIEWAESDCTERGATILTPDAGTSDGNDFIQQANGRGFKIERFGTHAVRVSWRAIVPAFPTGHAPMLTETLLWLD